MLAIRRLANQRRALLCDRVTIHTFPPRQPEQMA